MYDISLKQIFYIFSNIFVFFYQSKLFIISKCYLVFKINYFINFQNLPIVVMTTME